jgi:hypothetical protein
MTEILLAGGVVAVCAVLLLRLLLGDVRRHRLDAAVSRRWRSARLGVREAWQWRSVRRNAAREAEDAIRRARQGAKRDGNVIRPKQFESPKKPH